MVMMIHLLVASIEQYIVNIYVFIELFKFYGISSQGYINIVFHLSSPLPFIHSALVITELIVLVNELSSKTSPAINEPIRNSNRDSFMFISVIE